MFMLRALPSLPRIVKASPATAELPTTVPLGPVAQLTRRLASGEEQAFREFHANYFDRLYRFLLVVARGHEEEAKEALQETLVRVVRHVRVFESEEAFWDWLKVVGRSAARDAGRKQQRYRHLLERFSARRGDLEVEPGQENSALAVALDEALRALDPSDRELVEMKYLAGQTIQEIAGRTALTGKAVESRLLRLRRQLRQRVLEHLRHL